MSASQPDHVDDACELFGAPSAFYQTLISCGLDPVLSLAFARFHDEESARADEESIFLMILLCCSRGPDFPRERSVREILLSKLTSLDPFSSEDTARFGVSKHGFVHLADLLWPTEERRVLQSQKLGLCLLQLAATLFFLKTNSTQAVVAAQVEVSQPTVHKWIYRIVPLMATKLGRWLFRTHSIIPSMTVERLRTLPVWKDFPNVRAIVDTTISPGVRPKWFQCALAIDRFPSIFHLFVFLLQSSGTTCTRGCMV
jgi:hypothetical protein